MRLLMMALSFILFATHANALSLGDLSNTEASGGLKEALIQGASKAVSQLSAVDGFFGNKTLESEHLNSAIVVREELDQKWQNPYP